MNAQLQVTLSSFGFKYGVPPEATVIWDVRFLPNPYWVEEMRHKTGLEREVADYVLESPAAIQFLRLIEPLLLFLVQENLAGGKQQELWLAVGCTGGRHRSVAVVEALKSLLAGKVSLTVLHRDIERDSSAQ